jgi:hypothetical protein
MEANTRVADGLSGADFEPLGHKTGQYLVCETPEEDNLL